MDILVFLYKILRPHHRVWSIQANDMEKGYPVFMHVSSFNYGSVAFVVWISLALLFASARADKYEEGQKAFEEEACEAAFRLWLVSADQGHGPSHTGFGKALCERSRCPER